MVPGRKNTGTGSIKKPCFEAGRIYSGQASRLFGILFKYQFLNYFSITFDFHKDRSPVISAFSCQIAYTVFRVIAVSPVNHLK